MLKFTGFLALVTTVLADGVVLKASYGNQDMEAQSTIIRDGYAYPGGEVGYGGSGYSYSSRGGEGPFYSSVGKYGPVGVGGAIGGYYPGLPPVGPVGGGYGGIRYPGGYGVIEEPKYEFTGYYPKAIGLVGPGVGLGGPGIGLGGPGIGYGGPIGPVGLGGGEYINKNIYDSGKKELSDARFENSHGKKGEEYEEGEGGFKHGKTAIKDIKGDSGYYSGEEGGKKLAEDERNYYGGQHRNQEGKNESEQKIKQGHRKGHVIKGFKKSHHSDETGKTEEYYDEEHDEGGNLVFDGQSGNFGENQGSSYKGAHENGNFNANQGKKEGHYNSEHAIDNNNGGAGQYESKKYGGSGTNYGYKNGADEQSLLGHQQNNKFYKHQPHHAPFFSY